MCRNVSEIVCRALVRHVELRVHPLQSPLGMLVDFMDIVPVSLAVARDSARRRSAKLYKAEHSVLQTHTIIHTGEVNIKAEIQLALYSSSSLSSRSADAVAIISVQPAEPKCNMKDPSETGGGRDGSVL